ncbi:lysylphosphatidylglycerol synthase domain-containing protein [Actinocrispum sp. NPDC049592]|uniref:lysylphosphatidylglycerol synthase domain-containing protein n=1 Tax=Actinocrispum sp. NPDC049592 TaxID=3154835 RepID=UPI00341BC083
MVSTLEEKAPTRYRRALKAAAYVLAFGFLAYQLWRVRDGLGTSLRTVGWASAVLATLLGIAGGIPGFFAWRVLLTKLDVRLPLVSAVRVFFLAGLARYLPGGVWPALAHAVAAKPLGAPPARMAGAYLASQVLGLVAGMAVGLLALPRLVAADPVWWILLPVLLAALVPLVSPRLLAAAFRGVRRVSRRRDAGAFPLPDRGTLLVATGLSAAGWVVTGLSVTLLTVAFGAPIGPAVLIGVGGFALSMLAGMLAVVMPSGLGVRDVILGLTLATLVSGPDLVTVVVLNRVVLTVGDLASTAVVLGLLGWTVKPGPKGGSS